jgi:hypothetical protein
MTDIKEQKIKTLIYPGAGWDLKFLEFFKNLGYNNFILYDTLPKIPHYTKEQAGYPSQQNFYGVLKSYLGNYKRNFKNKNKLYFPEHNLTYYVSTDFTKVDVRDGDIYFRGWIPEYIQDEDFDNYKVDRLINKKNNNSPRKIYWSYDTVFPTENLDLHELDNFFIIEVTDKDYDIIESNNIKGYMDKLDFIDYIYENNNQESESEDND